MPIPVPRSHDRKKKFMDRCLKQMKDEFPDIGQRYAVCAKRWSEYKGVGKSGKLFNR